MTKLLNEKILQKLDTKNLAYFRFKKLDEETMLITNDLWAYSYLTNDEFKDFIQWWENLSSEKIKELSFKKFFKNTEYYKSDTKFEYGMKNSYLAFGPILHILVVTLRCNHKCQYCHAAVAPMSAKKMDMSIDTAQKVVDTMFFSTSPIITIEFQWWEALVNWDVVRFVIEYATKKWQKLQKKVDFCIVTNLSLMTDDKLQYLLDHNVNISTSLDGNDEIHNYNRTFQDGNSYEQVTYWIQKINGEYEKKAAQNGEDYAKKIGALTTVTKKTLPYYKELVDTYLDLGLDGIFLRPLNPYGFAAADLEKLWYSDEQFLEFYRNALDYILEINKGGKVLREHFSTIYLSKILKPRDPNFLDDRSPCWASIGQVAYNHDGKIYSCDEWRMLARMWINNFQIWEVSENPGLTYEQMIMSDTTDIMVQSSTLDGMPWYNESVYKPYMWVCPIHNYKSRGNVYPNFSLDSKKKISYGVIDYLFQKMKDSENKKVFLQWIREKWDVLPTCDN